MNFERFYKKNASDSSMEIRKKETTSEANAFTGRKVAPLLYAED